MEHAKQVPFGGWRGEGGVWSPSSHLWMLLVAPQPSTRASQLRASQKTASCRQALFRDALKVTVCDN